MHDPVTLSVGMETIVQVRCSVTGCGDTMMTGVVFGSAEFSVDSAAAPDTVGSPLVLFDVKTE